MTTDTTTTITTVDEIGALLDELAHALADVPGRRPLDAQIARLLLNYSISCLYGTPQASLLLLDTLAAYGADVSEAHTIARALSGAALRLGAWLGRRNAR